MITAEEKITPRRVSRANIKFRPQTYDASAAVLPRTSEASSPSRKPVECSRRALHISCRLAPERDATTAKLVVRSSLDENTADVSVNRPLLTLLRLSESRRPSLIKPPLIIFQYAPARWSTEIGDWPRRAGEESDGGDIARGGRGGGEGAKGRRGGLLRRLKRQELRGRNPRNMQPLSTTILRTAPSSYFARAQR